MKIAVIGASGFIARHFIPLALESGNGVAGIARHSPGHTGSGRTIERFRFAAGDVRNADTVRGLLSGCDAAIDLSPGFIAAEEGIAAILTGTRNVLSAAAEGGLKKFIALSCMEAEGSSRSRYHAARWQAEQLVRSSDVPHTILRSSLVLGNGDGMTRPLAELIRSYPVVPVPGRGIARHQPIDVDDLCRCILAALEDDSLAGQTVPVGGPMFITYRQLVDLIAGELGLLKPKILIPHALLPLATRLVPERARAIFSEPRVAQLQESVVASPGVVKRLFGFDPAPISSRMADYLAG